MIHTMMRMHIDGSLFRPFLLKCFSQLLPRVNHALVETPPNPPWVLQYGTSKDGLDCPLRYIYKLTCIVRKVSRWNDIFQIIISPNCMLNSLINVHNMKILPHMLCFQEPNKMHSRCMHCIFRRSHTSRQVMNQCMIRMIGWSLVIGLPVDQNMLMTLRLLIVIVIKFPCLI